MANHKKRRNGNHLQRRSKKHGAYYDWTKKRRPILDFLKRILKSFR